MADFNAEFLDLTRAARQLGLGRTRFYQLRKAFLANPDSCCPAARGGDHRQDWPPAAKRFLEEFLPLQNPPNYPLVADELEQLCGFGRARSSVADYLPAHYAQLVPAPARPPRGYRRFRRARIGELWPHDSSLHPGWPAPSKQTLRLPLDDPSGLNLAGRFVPSDTTGNHFEHFRPALETWGLPQIVYPDGLRLFGPSSSTDHRDPKSQFQRARRGLGVAHRMAPTPPAKGKIERRFGTFQRRLLTRPAPAHAETWQPADELLQMEIARQNRTLNRSTGQIPIEVWKAQSLQGEGRLRPGPPPALLDLHLSLRARRRVHHDHPLDFDGHHYEISPTRRKSVTLVYHPGRRFWVVEHPPKDVWPPIPGRFSR